MLNQNNQNQKNQIMQDDIEEIHDLPNGNQESSSVIDNLQKNSLTEIKVDNTKKTKKSKNKKKRKFPIVEHSLANGVQNYAIVSTENSMNPEIQMIKANDRKFLSQNKTSFSTILKKHKIVDFHITQNVSPNLKIRLFDGNIIKICYSKKESIYDIRKKINDITHIPVPYIVPSFNGQPLGCCWICTMSKDSYYTRIENYHDFDNITIDLGYKIFCRYFPCDPNYHFNNREIVVCTPPGTLNDLFDHITYMYNDLWFLKGCHIKMILPNNEIVIPSNETMSEKGIETGSLIDIFNDWNSSITINNTTLDCNLDDPILELIWRYINTRFHKLKCTKYIIKMNDNIIGELNTLKELGIKNDDHLKCEIKKILFTICAIIVINDSKFEFQFLI